MGFYEVESTEAGAILFVIHDVLTIKRMCYDGVSAMLCYKSTVAIRYREEEPTAIYIIYSGRII